MSGGAGIAVEELMIPSGTAGIELHIRRKRLASQAVFAAERTVLLMHGATFGSGSLYDVPLGGVSFMDWLAGAGYDAYAVDVRGYGRSTRPPEMSSTPELNAPLVRTETAVEDFAAAAAYVRASRGLERHAVIGMSWGGSVAGAYTSRHNEFVTKLALIAPQWLSEMPVRIDPGGPLAAYRRVPVLASRDQLLEGVPEAARPGLLPEGWFEQWAAASLADDPGGSAETPQVLRAPSGAVLDVREYWRAGKPFYDPAEIRVPVLLTHAEWDVDVPMELALAYFRRLTGAPSRRWMEVGEGTHRVILEKNRRQVFDAIRAFLDEEYMPER